eukprot:TRINITY_DN6753_c0_g1_i1.p2 TRINITY_DN6753_c0_g1~~TRINITY_DN6753_c0_g1_i1.p2  ORF type:complete len:413 (-),score=75.47 TRINITY_DN6753_c0_g1_i1:278-1516(-)
MAALLDDEKLACSEILKRSILLSKCNEKQLQDLSNSTTKVVYKLDEIIQAEGTPQQNLYVLVDGQMVRRKVIDGQLHQLDTFTGGQTSGSLHAMTKDPAHATCICGSDRCVVYKLPSDVIANKFREDPDFAWNVTRGLQLEVRRHIRQRTPLLEQQSKPLPIVPVSIAASVESFYRAALNAFINQKLTGVPMTSLFPNMHIQVPIRVLYINGFKGIRQLLDTNVDPNQYSNPTLVRLSAAITPGIVMTPLSSILEASNAGHANPEPMARRWTRGLVPRTCREVIFGVGLNQLSDYCEERVPYWVNSSAIKNAVGSLMAGVICGYLSHVVHNLSTLKLMNPAKNYNEHIKDYISRSEQRVPAYLSPASRRFGALFAAIFFPTGCIIRTTQIVGSFVILNGTINAIDHLFPQKK